MNATCPEQGRFDVLDGWRGISILLVLAAHLLPIGPKALQLNEAVGVVGMALFFTLSGFLITSFLLRHESVVDFLIRRVFRIVPLAWLYLALALFFVGAAADTYPPSFLFYANLPPFWLTDTTGHLWSVCVEMQFYLGVGFLFWALGSRGLRLLLPLAVAVTGWRVYSEAEVSIVTWLRVDEILAGCVLALVYFRCWGERPRAALRGLNPYLLLALLAVASHQSGGPLNYLRPYLAAALVGATLLRGDCLMSRGLLIEPLKYIAAISFALYVIHPLLGSTWLGGGLGWEKYVRRPLLFGVLFALAHLSSFYYERPAIALGKRLSACWRSRKSKAQR
ncbi:MAG: acyltransferase [Rhizobacter sp.]|nr:acyltransferase [Rhizobacter sp.]